MKTIRISAIVLALLSAYLAHPVNGQTAKVVELSPADTAYVKSLYDQKTAIEKKIEEVRTATAEKYLVKEKIIPPEPNTESLSTVSLKRKIFSSAPFIFLGDSWVIYVPGFESGQFEYSDDFRFIVPLVPDPSNDHTCGLVAVDD